MRLPCLHGWQFRNNACAPFAYRDTWLEMIQTLSDDIYHSASLVSIRARVKRSLSTQFSSKRAGSTPRGWGGFITAVAVRLRN